MNNSIERPEGINENSDHLDEELEVSIVEPGNEAICIIKPDAFAKRGEIIKRLEDSGLYIVRHNSKELTEDIVREMVLKGRGMSPEIEDATLRHLLSGNSEIVLVRSERVIPTLMRVVGDKTNPNMCNEDTVRYIFGDHNPEKLDAGGTYFRNAAHRPTDLEEQEKDKINFTRFT